MLVSELVSYLDHLLNVTAFKDYCPNGLQVSGRREVLKIVSGVSACQALLDVAVEREADLLLVHHGYFWKGENPCVVGLKQRHLKSLLTHDINLLAYHLPLDAHPVYGNNAELGQQLGFAVTEILNDGLLYIGQLTKPCSAIKLQSSINDVLSREPQLIQARNTTIETIAWCTGAAQDVITQVADLGVDAYLSGEISERTFHQAHEYGIDYFAAGHHATEMFGVQALGKHLAEKFSLEVEFVNIVNPV